MISKTFENLICDILLQSDVIISIKNSGGICEARLQENMKFKMRDQWATIGEESSPWHIHININEISSAKFIREFNKSHNRESFSIRFFDSNENLVLRANFSKLYDQNGNLIPDKISKFQYLWEKYGKKETLNFKNFIN
jgi:putative heme iron utilization protein